MNFFIADFPNMPKCTNTSILVCWWRLTGQLDSILASNTYFALRDTRLIEAIYNRNFQLAFQKVVQQTFDLRRYYNTENYVQRSIYFNELVSFVNLTALMELFWRIGPNCYEGK